MTTLEFKKEEKGIKRAFVILKNDKNKARKFLIRVGLVNRNGQPKDLTKKD